MCSFAIALALCIRHLWFIEISLVIGTAVRRRRSFCGLRTVSLPVNTMRSRVLRSIQYIAYDSGFLRVRYSFVGQSDVIAASWFVLMQYVVVQRDETGSFVLRSGLCLALRHCS